MSTSKKGAPMPERDGYMPGVPCWIDTSQPDPEAAVDFYSGLFGWDLEDVTPPVAPSTDVSSRMGGARPRRRRGDVAAAGLRRLLGRERAGPARAHGGERRAGGIRGRRRDD